MRQQARITVGFVLGVASMEVLASGLPLDWQIAGIGDLDNNGTADEVWRHASSGTVAAWLMNRLAVSEPGLITSGVPLAWEMAQ